MKTRRNHDYSRVCRDCEAHELKQKKFDMCTVPVDIVTGNPTPVQCYDARSSVGHCGPDGHRFSAARIVRTPTVLTRQPRTKAKPKKVPA